MNAMMQNRKMQTGTANVYVPTHYSSTSILYKLTESTTTATPAITLNGEIDGNESAASASASASASQRQQVLIIHCHGDGGIMWRGLFPMLQKCISIYHDTSTSPSLCSNLVSILAQHFHCYVNDGHPISLREKLGSDDLFHRFTCNYYGYSKHSHDKSPSNQNIVDTNLHMILLPPSPCPYSFHSPNPTNTNISKNTLRTKTLSVSPPLSFSSFASSQSQYSSTFKCLYPERIFTPHLIRLENQFLKLQTLNAYLSTMGGGYFLCRYLDTSIQIARQQRLVALAMGDIPLAFKCIINEAYNWIHFGNVPKAMQILKWVEQQVQHKQQMFMCANTTTATTTGTTNGTDTATNGKTNTNQNGSKKNGSRGRLCIITDPDFNPEYTILYNMCLSAKLFAKRVQREQRSENEVIGGNMKSRRRRWNETQQLYDKLGTQGTTDTTQEHVSHLSMDGAFHNCNTTKQPVYTATHDDFQRIRITTTSSYKRIK